MILQDFILYFSKILSERIFAWNEYSIWENERKLTLDSHRVRAQKQWLEESESEFQHERFAL